MDMEITRMVAENPVVIFGKSSCPMTLVQTLLFMSLMKSLIYGFGANPTVYALDEIPNGQQIEAALLQLLGGRSRLPAVFIGKMLIGAGGPQELLTLHLKNYIRPLLICAGSI